MENDKTYDFANGIFEVNEIAETLGNVIVNENPPFAVGVFGKWNSGKTELLQHTQDEMEKVTESGEKKDFKIQILSLIFRLLFFYPILNSSRKKDVKMIFVNFSILDYAGSDKMWAAIITRISYKIDEMFGKLAVKMFRAWHYKPYKHLNPFLEENVEVNFSKKNWKFPSLKVFLKPLLFVLLVGLAITMWIFFGIPQSTANKPSSGQTASIALSSILGVGVILRAKQVFNVIKNLIQTQVQMIINLTKKPDFSESLGFMGKVKNEVYYITSVVRYMGVLLDKDIRICLVIDDVDLLQKEQVMNLLQIVSLLHSSPNSIYIQLLCMDHMIAANVIKKALSKEMSSNVSGHAYIKKIIELPFYIPFLSYKQSKWKLLKKSRSTNLDEVVYAESNSLLAENKENNSTKLQLLNTNDSWYKENEVASTPRKFDKLQESVVFEHDVASHIVGNRKALKRILISTQLTMQIILSKDSQLLSKFDRKKLIAWITFIDLWPYRISWIRQVIEDNIQSHRIDNDLVRLISDTALLEDVYNLVEARLCDPQDWKNLLSLDNDPEMFINFLQVFPFTVSDLKSLLPYTINLNTSLRGIIGLCSAKHHVKRLAATSVKDKLKNSPPLESWSVNEVCDELENMKMSKKRVEDYKEAVRAKDITGEKLATASKSDIRGKINMAPGDWNVFWKIIKAFRIFKQAGSELKEPKKKNF